jgi:hypothetical protein
MALDHRLWPPFPGLLLHDIEDELRLGIAMLGPA